MATFSPTTLASNTAATSTVSLPPPPPALSYHHLHSTLNTSHNQNSNSSPLSDERLSQANEANGNQSFDTHVSYENNTDYSLCAPSHQSGNPFDVAASTPSSSSSHYNQDPIVRHFFHYRQNESNFTGNYYSNISTGSFVNAFDYSYSNIAPAPSSNHPPDASVAHHSFPPPFPPHHHHHHHPFVHSYLPYQQPAQPSLKQADSFAIPVQLQQQQQHHQPANQQQSIYPWMRRIHNHTGELSSADRFFVYIRTSTFEHRHTIFFFFFMGYLRRSLTREKGDLWARCRQDE